MEVVEKKSPKWVKGQSGNPAGRPKGSKNAITLAKLQLEGELRAQMGPQMVQVMQKAIDLALQGDTMMIKLLVDSCVSKSRAGSDDDAPREKVVIQVGRLDQGPVPINGRVVPNEENE